jgi:Trypsin-like peptidase domain
VLARSTVTIASEFTEEEQKATPGVIGIGGSGWFLSPRRIVTAAHVAEAMLLSRQQWREIEIHAAEIKTSMPVRILRTAGDHSEKVAVLELLTPFQRAETPRVRMDPLIPDEQIVSLAHPNHQSRVAGGRFVQYGDAPGFAGTALLELYDGMDRLVIDHGASGAPVFDCQGRVVAVVTNVLTQEVNLLSRTMRASTPWQTPNVVSIPTLVLQDFLTPVETSHLSMPDGSR